MRGVVTLPEPGFLGGVVALLAVIVLLVVFIALMAGADSSPEYRCGKAGYMEYKPVSRHDWQPLQPTERCEYDR